MIHSKHPRRRFQALLAVFAALAASTAPAQEGGDPAWPAVFRDTTDVNVVNVDVVVTDRDGRPVSGLGKEDFELLLGGVAVPISNFYAVEGGRVLPVGPAAGEPADGETADGEEPKAREAERRLYLAVFVDSPNLSSTSRGRIFSRLREVLLANRRDDVHVTLAVPAATSTGVEVVGASDVPHETFAALAELERQTVGTNRLEIELRQVLRDVEAVAVDGGFDDVGLKYDPTVSPDPERIVAAQAEDLLPRIRAYAQQRFDGTRRSLASLAAMVDLLAGLPGRKALLYVSDGLPMRSGEAVFEAYSHRVQAIDSSTVGFAEFSPASEAARYDASPLFAALMRRSNAARVSFYTLDAAPPAAFRRGAAETRTPARAGGYETVEESSRESSLTFMAEETGGRAALGTSVIDAALDGVYHDFDNHYSLGFVASQDAPKDVEVRLRGRRDGLTVRYRRSWTPRTPEQRMAELTLSALLEEDPGNPLGVGLGTGEPTAGKRGRVVVPLLVEVPLGRLVLLPEKSEHTARVSLYVAARDEKGRMSEVARHLCPIRIPNSEMLVALGRSTVCGVRLTLRTGRQTVAVVVHDEIADVVSTTGLKVDVREPEPAVAKAGDPESGSRP